MFLKLGLADPNEGLFHLLWKRRTFQCISENDIETLVHTYKDLYRWEFSHFILIFSIHFATARLMVELEIQLMSLLWMVWSFFLKTRKNKSFSIFWNVSPYILHIVTKIFLRTLFFLFQDFVQIDWSFSMNDLHFWASISSSWSTKSFLNLFMSKMITDTFFWFLQQVLQVFPLLWGDFWIGQFA